MKTASKDFREKTPRQLAGLLPVLVAGLLHLAPPSWLNARAGEEGGQLPSDRPQAQWQKPVLHPAVYRGQPAPWHIRPVGEGQWAALHPQMRPDEQAVRSLVPGSGAGGDRAGGQALWQRHRFSPLPGGLALRLQAQYVPAGPAGNPWSSEDRTVVPPVYRRGGNGGSGNVWGTGSSTGRQIQSPGPKRYSRRIPGQTGSTSSRPDMQPYDGGRSGGRPEPGSEQRQGQAPVFGNYPPLEEDRGAASREPEQTGRGRAFASGNQAPDGRRPAYGQNGAPLWQPAVPPVPNWGYLPYPGAPVPVPPPPLPW